MQSLRSSVFRSLRPRVAPRLVRWSGSEAGDSVRFATHPAHRVPDYMRDVYTWAYINPFNVKLLDRQIVVDTLLFFNARALEREVLSRIRKGSKVLQAGHTHGHLVPLAADQVGSTGHFKVVDVTPIQANQAKAKLRARPWCEVVLGDACDTTVIEPDGQYDTVFAFMLLHEIPDDRKQQVVDNMIRAVRPGGKAVWVEYHGPPYWYNPTRYFMPFVFRWLEPFALRLWEKEIQSFATPDLQQQCNWSKEVYGGNLYQVIVAEKKETA